MMPLPAQTDLGGRESDPSDCADTEMIDIQLDVPPSTAARTISVTRGDLIIPPPLELDQCDLTPA
jgi:hypothetical protein